MGHHPEVGQVSDACEDVEQYGHTNEAGSAFLLLCKDVLTRLVVLLYLCISNIQAGS